MPDLVLMDMAMPTLDGYEATRRIKAGKCGPIRPVVAVTAHALGDQLASVIDSGVDDVLHKPIELTATLEVVARHLGLEYIYEDFTAHVEPLRDDSQLITALTGVSADLLGEAQQAITLGDLDQLSERIDALSKHAPETGPALRVMMEQYELEHLSDLLAAAAEEVASAVS